MRVVQAKITSPEDIGVGLKSGQGILSVDDIPVKVSLEYVSDPLFDKLGPSNAEMVFVRVKAFSLNFRDRALMLGFAPRSSLGGLGSEFAGEVVAVGADVIEFSTGDLVMSNMSWPDSGSPNVSGGVASNVASRELQWFHKSKLIRIPSGMALTDAAAFVLSAQTAFSMVRRLGVGPKNVLVTAATSNTSLFAIQALRLAGMSPYALTRSGEALDRLLELGSAGVCLLPASRDFSGLYRLTADLGGFDAIIDPFSDIYISEALKVAKSFATYITCGMLAQGFTSPVPGPAWSEMLPQVIHRGMSIVGNCLGLAEDLQAAIDCWKDGGLTIVVDSVYGDLNVVDFVGRSFNDADRFGKVVFAYSPSAAGRDVGPATTYPDSQR